MSLNGSLATSASSLAAAQSAMQLIGNNLANVNTPGYARQKINQAAILPTFQGGISAGNGVQIRGSSQIVDNYLNARTQQASSHYQAASTRSQSLGRVQDIFNELSGNGLSDSINDFFNSINDIQSQPNDPALRSQVVQNASYLSSTLRNIREQIDQFRDDTSNEVEQSVPKINQLIGQVRTLNAQIVALESGVLEGDAGSIRSQRTQLLGQIGDKIDITTYEEPDGSINVFSGNEFLLMRGATQDVATQTVSDRGSIIKQLIFADSHAPVPTTGGRLGGLQDARDNAAGTIIDRLDAISSSLIFEFNKVYSSGQGLDPFTSIVSENHVLDPTAALDSQSVGATAGADLPFTPTNGSFELRINNATTGLAQTFVINVALDGTAAGDSLNDIVTKINTAFGSAAASVVAGQGKLQIQAPTGSSFTFANDTSGFLAAMGVNTFFSGTDSRSIDINSLVSNNPRNFAASSNGNPGDVTNAIALAQFRDRSFSVLGNQTFSTYYSSTVERLGSLADTALSDTQIQETTKNALESENLSISGVNIDEETLKLLQYQRIFQASSKHISAVNQMMEELLGLVT